MSIENFKIGDCLVPKKGKEKKCGTYNSLDGDEIMIATIETGLRGYFIYRRGKHVGRCFGCFGNEDLEYKTEYKTNAPIDFVTSIPMTTDTISIGTKEMTVLQTVGSALKRAVSPSLQAQYKAGLRNGSLELTDRGFRELVEFLATVHEKELTAIAKEIIAEAEAKN